MNIKFSFDETNVQVGFENQFVIKDMTEDTLVKILMLKGEKGDTVSAQWGTIIGNLTDQTDLKNALNSKANASDLNTTNSNVATNTSNIATNTSNIAENTADIEDNAEDIAELQTQVGTNTSNIATNTSNIATNTGNIATNTSNIASNKADIGTLNNLTTIDKASLVNAVNEINVPAKWVSVGSTATENGERVWFKKGKNLYNNALICANLIKTRTTITYENEQIVMSTTGADAYFGNIVSVGNSWSEPYGQLISIEPNTTYSLSITNNIADKNFITYYDENKVSIQIVYDQPYQVTFTTPNNAKYVSFRIGTANSTSDGVYKFNIQLEKGSTVTTYEPYVEPSIYIDEELLYQKPVVLYKNSSGTTISLTDTTINLSDSISNYSFVEIKFSTSGINRTTGKVYVSSSSINVNFFVFYLANSTTIQQKFGKATISGTSLTLNQAGYINVVGSTISSSTASGGWTIYEVVGYK